MKNRNGLVVRAVVTHADGIGERRATPQNQRDQGRHADHGGLQELSSPARAE
jgi:hypothetical protein